MKVSSKGSFSQARLIAPPSLARSCMGSPLQTTSSQKADLFFRKTSTFTHPFAFYLCARTWVEFSCEGLPFDELATVFSCHTWEIPQQILHLFFWVAHKIQQYFFPLTGSQTKSKNTFSPVLSSGSMCLHYFARFAEERTGRLFKKDILGTLILCFDYCCLLWLAKRRTGDLSPKWENKGKRI